MAALRSGRNKKRKLNTGAAQPEPQKPAKVQEQEEDNDSWSSPVRRIFGDRGIPRRFVPRTANAVRSHRRKSIESIASAAPSNSSDYETEYEPETEPPQLPTPTSDVQSNVSTWVAGLESNGVDNNPGMAVPSHTSQEEPELRDEPPQHPQTPSSTKTDGDGFPKVVRSQVNQMDVDNDYDQAIASNDKLMQSIERDEPQPALMHIDPDDTETDENLTIVDHNETEIDEDATVTDVAVAEVNDDATLIVSDSDETASEEEAEPDTDKMEISNEPSLALPTQQGLQHSGAEENVQPLSSDNASGQLKEPLSESLELQEGGAVPIAALGGESPRTHISIVDFGLKSNESGHKASLNPNAPRYEEVTITQLVTLTRSEYPLFDTRRFLLISTDDSSDASHIPDSTVPESRLPGPESEPWGSGGQDETRVADMEGMSGIRGRSQSTDSFTIADEGSPRECEVLLVSAVLEYGKATAVSESLDFQRRSDRSRSAARRSLLPKEPEFPKRPFSTALESLQHQKSTERSRLITRSPSNSQQDRWAPNMDLSPVIVAFGDAMDENTDAEREPVDEMSDSQCSHELDSGLMVINIPQAVQSQDTDDKCQSVSAVPGFQGSVELDRELLAIEADAQENSNKRGECTVEEIDGGILPVNVLTSQRSHSVAGDPQKSHREHEQGGSPELGIELPSPESLTRDTSLVDFHQEADAPKAGPNTIVAPELDSVMFSMVSQPVSHLEKNKSSLRLAIPVPIPRQLPGDAGHHYATLQNELHPEALFVRKESKTGDRSSEEGASSTLSPAKSASPFRETGSSSDGNISVNDPSSASFNSELLHTNDSQLDSPVSSSLSSVTSISWLRGSEASAKNSERALPDLARPTEPFQSKESIPAHHQDQKSIAEEGSTNAKEANLGTQGNMANTLANNATAAETDRSQAMTRRQTRSRTVGTTATRTSTRRAAAEPLYAAHTVLPDSERERTILLDLYRQTNGNIRIIRNSLPGSKGRGAGETERLLRILRDASDLGQVKLTKNHLQKVRKMAAAAIFVDEVTGKKSGDTIVSKGGCLIKNWRDCPKCSIGQAVHDDE